MAMHYSNTCVITYLKIKTDSLRRLSDQALQKEAETVICYGGSPLSPSSPLGEERNSKKTWKGCQEGKVLAETTAKRKLTTKTMSGTSLKAIGMQWIASTRRRGNCIFRLRFDMKGESEFWYGGLVVVMMMGR